MRRGVREGPGIPSEATACVEWNAPVLPEFARWQKAQASEFGRSAERHIASSAQVGAIGVLLPGTRGRRAD